MAAARGRIVLQDQDPSIQLTSRPCDVVVNGGAVVRVDMIDPNATFDCNEGDNYTVTPVGSVNAQGQTGPAGNAFSGTCTLGGGGVGLPAAEVVTGVDFTAV